MSDSPIIGPDLIKARRASGLTQADFADLVGVSLRTIGNWELGKTRIHPKHYADLLAALPGLAGNESATPIQGEPQMVDNEDTQIRLEALRLAVQLGIAEHDSPEYIKESAAIFYEFLKDDKRPHLAKGGVTMQSNFVQIGDSPSGDAVIPLGKPREESA